MIKYIELILEYLNTLTVLDKCLTIATISLIIYIIFGIVRMISEINYIKHSQEAILGALFSLDLSLKLIGKMMTVKYESEDPEFMDKIDELTQKYQK